MPGAPPARTSLEPAMAQVQTWPERLLDLLRRLLFPGSEPRPVPARVPVPVREPAARRRL
jgi:hypothetical protein